MGCAEMTGAENIRIAELSDRLSRVETQLESLAEMKADVRTTREQLATAKGWRLGFLTALPALGGGGVGAALVKFFGSGGGAN